MALVLTEPFDNLTAWTLSGSPTIVAGRTGTAANITGPTQRLNYAIPSGDQTAEITIGFSWQTTALQVGGNSIVGFHSDTNTTSHTRLAVTSAGALAVDRGGTALVSSSTGLILPNVWYYIEVRFKLGDAPNGYALVRLNGIEVINTAGLDTKNAGTKAVYDAIRLGPVNASSGGTNLYDDLYFRSDTSFQGDPLGPVRSARHSARVGFVTPPTIVDWYRLARHSVRVGIGPAVAPPAATVGVWTGAAFADSPVSIWSGSAFVDAVAVKTWDGSAFV